MVRRVGLRRTVAGLPLVDLAVGVGLLAVGVADALTTDEYAGGQPRLLVAVVLQTLPLVWRRTHTLLAVALSLLGVTIEVAGTEPYGGLYGLLGFVLLTHATARWASGWQQRYATGALVAGIVVHTLSEGTTTGPLGWIGPTLITVAVAGAAWAIGTLGRAGHERELALVEDAQVAAAAWERRQQEVIEEERARISRELHDVVGHALAGISLTAGAAQQQEGSRNPDMATALELIRTLSRDAASDVRRLLDLLREDSEAGGSPQPTLDDLPDLIDRARGAGLTVEHESSGTPVQIPGGLHLAAYRVVQEGLTNVARHAPGATVRVRTHWQPGRLEVEVSNTAGTDVEEPHRGGHGLVGLRERVSVFDGTLCAEPGPEGGFVLRAGFPLP